MKFKGVSKFKRDSKNIFLRGGPNFRRGGGWNVMEELEPPRTPSCFEVHCFSKKNVSFHGLPTIQKCSQHVKINGNWCHRPFSLRDRY